MRCSECGREYAEESGGCQRCGACGVPDGPYRELLPLRGLGGLLTGLLALTAAMIVVQLVLRVTALLVLVPASARVAAGSVRSAV